MWPLALVLTSFLVALVMLIALALLNLLKPRCLCCGKRVWVHEAQAIIIGNEEQKQYLYLHKDCVTRTWHKGVWTCR